MLFKLSHKENCILILDMTTQWYGTICSTLLSCGEFPNNFFLTESVITNQRQYYFADRNAASQIGINLTFNGFGISCNLTLLISTKIFFCLDNITSGDILFYCHYPSSGLNLIKHTLHYVNQVDHLWRWPFLFITAMAHYFDTSKPQKPICRRTFLYI